MFPHILTLLVGGKRQLQDGRRKGRGIVEKQIQVDDFGKSGKSEGMDRAGIDGLLHSFPECCVFVVLALAEEYQVEPVQLQAD